ncbi:MAG TPA: HAD-IA family hydrolase [Dehalococcoidia bacterium]|nr:HAD-IA family hydrolase [Dehalococcoidia bacterium]
MTSKLAVMVSGSGTTLQSFLDLIAAEQLDASIEVVIGSNSTAFALERARKAGIDTHVVRRGDFETQEAFSDAVTAVIDRYGVELILGGLPAALPVPSAPPGRPAASATASPAGSAARCCAPSPVPTRQHRRRQGQGAGAPACQPALAPLSPRTQNAPMTRIEVVVLDFDGVLNTSMVFGEWLAREHAITREQQGHFFDGLFADCNSGDADMLDVLPPFLDQWRWPYTLDAFVEHWFTLDDNLAPDVMDVVDSLREAGIPVVLATNQEQHRAEYIRNHPDLAGRFDHRFFSCDLGVAKPDARYFERVADELGRPASELLFFDDHPGNVDAARSGGWNAEQFTDVDKLTTDLQRYLAQP